MLESLLAIGIVGVEAPNDVDSRDRMMQRIFGQLCLSLSHG